ncbi:MAG TPA: FxSxx-COOH system tetratricopeptide repeat protein [Pyrinomonadaceae bacterium]|nr:FxSxx-COOH system tetratricopeptide repeat protein [Pyrinomonadaceae bacterium]
MKSPSIFLSYSHKDEDEKEALVTQLRVLEHAAEVCLWNDDRIEAGGDWNREIEEAMAEAKVAVLLITANFLNSRFIREVEVPRLIGRHRAGELKIFPVIATDCAWQTVKWLREMNVRPKNGRPVWAGSEAEAAEHLADIAREIASVLDNIRPEQDAASAPGRSSEPPETLRNVPETDTLFSGREDVLRQLHEILTTPPRRAVLSGMGGIGKTRTAIEYANRHRADYTGIFWTGADAESTLISGFVDIAKLLKLVKDNTHPKDAVAAAQSWLRSHPGWLLILDNVESLQTARKFYLPCGQGAVLLTTRLAKTGGLQVEHLPMDKMSAEEGALLLLRRAQRLGDKEPLEAATPEDREAARMISEELGGLPLALYQAGAFIDEMFSSPTNYLELYREKGMELIDWRGESESDEPTSVTITFSLAFEEIVAKNSATADLLRLCAFLAPDSIPEEILIKGAPELGDELGAAMADNLSRTRVIAAVARFSLIGFDPDPPRVLSIHRLVQRVLRGQMDNEMQRLWIERAIRALNRAFPERDFFECWETCRLLIPHVRECARLIEEWRIGFPEAGHLLASAGVYLWERAAYRETENFFKLAQKIREKQPGPEHTDLARSLHHLADLYREEGRFTEAESLYLRELKLWERVQRLDVRLDLTRCLHGLALLYRDWGRYDKAERLFQRAIPIRVSVLGEGSLHVAWLRGDLGELYCYVGRFDEAKTLLEDAIEVIEKTGGSRHPLVGLYLRDLATYCKLIEPPEAEKILVRAMDIQKNLYGSDHLHIAKTLYGFARLYNETGRYEEAQNYYKRAKEILEKSVPENHPDYALVLNDFAWYYHQRGNFSEAETLYLRVLEIRKNVFGHEDAGIARTLDNYALLLEETERAAEAEALRKQAGAIRAKAAPDNPTGNAPADAPAPQGDAATEST